MKRGIFVISLLLFLIYCLDLNFEINARSYNKQKFTPEDSLISINFLRKQIYSVLKKINENKNSYGIAVYSMDRKEYFFKHNIDQNFVPASLTKLFTTIGALVKFGPDYKVKTYLYYVGTIEKEILKGNLYIYGTGDALFSTSDLDYLAEKVANLGIKEIRGGIYADPSFFDSQTDRFIYSGDFDVVQKTPPITSLSIEKNIVNVIVTSGSIPGRFVNVQIFPNSEAFRIVNLAKVVRAYGENKNHIESNQSFGDQSFLVQQRRTQPSSSDKSVGIKIESFLDSSGVQTIRILGSLVSGSTKTYSFFIENPSLAVAGALKYRLENFGIKITEKSAIKQIPNESLNLLGVVERSLVEILQVMNKNSDNFVAEVVFKMIGGYDRKMTSNSKEAVRYIFKLLDSLQISCLDCKMYDGSGLSRRNRFTPESLIQLLAFAKSNLQTNVIDSVLAIAGYDGTLKSRMNKTPAEGKILAKTGTHSNASGLAGFARTLDGERLIFAFLFNGEKVGTYKSTEDSLCIILASFFYSNKIE
ncbi:MAG: D-alanyl-D-alanine carboxypeptidase/D-alanyl-D-alanine-endopeptidase [Ignavibacteria bacterium]|nr:D-alanyl-D-alanine carboxypeptidase/D-alanyl-D-alanine-endopeptidase [Ignavibacteria bacterium]